MNPRKPVIAVCIATYKRPAQLHALLESLKRMEVPDGYDLEIRVVDNDARRSAEATVLAQQTDPGNPVLLYVVEPRSNISLARNRALEMGRADLVFFVDDDETVEEGCLTALHETFRRTEADVVVGFVGCHVPSEAPAWIARGGFLDHPTGTSGAEIGWNETRCGCTLVDGYWFYEDGMRFDPGYGKSGGEDVDLFFRMAARGARLRAEPEARAWETVPLERASLIGLGLRRWRNGLCFERIEARNPAGIYPPVRAAVRLLKVAGGTLAGLPAALGGYPEEMYRALLLLPLTAGGLVAWIRPAHADSAGGYGAKPATCIEGDPSCA